MKTLTAKLGINAAPSTVAALRVAANAIPPPENKASVREIVFRMSGSANPAQAAIAVSPSIAKMQGCAPGMEVSVKA
jgi:hypothetical protein